VAVNRRELARRIEGFPQWHYQFNLKGIMTPIFDKSHLNRHEQRKRYFFDPLVRLLGGSLEGMRVLDLGCNAGFWSLQAIRNGCDYVLGIDARKFHVEQARLVFNVNEVDKSRYSFVTANIFDIDFGRWGSFDIVLCLGILYHICKPICLLEKISNVNRDVLVIDASLSMLPGCALKVRHEDLSDPRSGVQDLSLIPTRRAVIQFALQFGYQVAVLKPEFTDYMGCHDYENGSRRAFICSKKTDLNLLSKDDLENKLPVTKRVGGFVRELISFISARGSLDETIMSSKLFHDEVCRWCPL